MRRRPTGMALPPGWNAAMRRWAGVALVALAAFLAGCASGPYVGLREPSGAVSPAAAGAPPESGFSAELATPARRESAFQQAWRLVDERFYDPGFNGVDWEAVRLEYLPQLERVHSDNQFYALLGRMVGELRDSHTRAYNARDYRNRRAYVASTHGVRIAEVEGEVAITEVLAGSSADRLGVKPGMVVLRVNGEPVRERIRRIGRDMPPEASVERRERNLYGRVMSGRGVLPLELEVMDGDIERRFELARAEQAIPLRVEARMLDGHTGYVAFNRFRPEGAAQFGRALGAVGGADGLIIDLRGNPGGSIGAMLAIARDFFPETRHVLTRLTRATGADAASDDGDARARDRPPAKVRIPANRAAYAHPLAILIDGYSASSAELLATILREQRGARVFGRPSCGCVVGVRGSGYPLPGGGALYVAETGFITPAGNRMEGAGMRPDEVVPLTIAGLRAGADRDIEAARRWLAAQPHLVAAAE